MKTFLSLSADVRKSIGFLALALVLFGGSKWLIDRHLDALHNVSGTVLPLAAEVVPLEERLQVLRQQVELSGLQAALRSGTAEEKLRAYVLPEGSDLTRIVSFFDVVRTSLAKRGLLKDLSRIEIGEPASFALQGDSSQRPLQSEKISFTAVVKPEGFTQLQALLGISGLITVGDALDAKDISMLFALTESENYAGIVPVEQFLSTDLLEYLRDPAPADQNLTRAFPSDDFLTRFRELLDASRLASAKAALAGPLADELAAQRLWPLPFLIPVTTDVQEERGGWMRVTVEADVVSRATDALND